jgi:methionine biosynthesis protein MetW
MKYYHDRLDFSSLNANNIDRIQLEMIPANSRVLEIGCATGHLSQYLIEEKNCTIVGVEADPEQAAVAGTRGVTVICGFADQAGTQAQVDDWVRGHAPFDVVFMSQVIEHLARPKPMLVKISDWLADEGLLVVSTCNVAHWKCRLRLLCGRWEYEDYGILDRDHLRFFTLKNFPSLLQAGGYRVVESGFSFQDICPFKMMFDFRLLAPTDILRLIPLVGKGLRARYMHLMRNVIATQFVYTAVKNKKNDS